MTRLVRLTILIKKIDSISDEEFHRHWSDPHARLALSLEALQKTLVRYSQFHIDPAQRKHLADLGMPMLDYDGGVDLWFRTMDDLQEWFGSDDYHKILRHDEVNFMDGTVSKMLIGYDEEHSMDGKTVDGMPRN